MIGLRASVAAAACEHSGRFLLSNHCCSPYTSIYLDANGSSYVVLEHLQIEWNVPDNYEIIKRVGGGKYSEVSTPYMSSNMVIWLTKTTGIPRNRHVQRRDMCHQGPEARSKAKDQARD